MISALQFQGLRFVGVALVFLPSWTERPLFELIWIVYRTVQAKEIRRVRDHVRQSPMAKSLQIKDIYWNLFCNGLDSLRYLIQPNTLGNRVAIVHGELLTNLLALNKPVVVVSIHMGAFEMLHRVLAGFGAPVRLIVSKHLPRGIERYLHKARAVANLVTYNPGESAQLLRDLLRKGGILAILCDQSRHGKGVPLPLLGRLTELWTRIPCAACSAGATVLSIRAIRRGRTHEIHFETLYAPETPADSLNQELAKEFETWILDSPAQWSWNYPRLWQEFCYSTVDTTKNVSL
jgi:KDO2-lipid IV(A) lauroyltransferase